MGVKICSLWALFGLSFFVIPYRSHCEVAVLKASSKLYLPPNTTGPQSIAFPYYSNNISFSPLYTSTSDGKVVRYIDGRFRGFAATAPNRSEENISKMCDGKSDPSLEHICGRPLGLAFNHVTRDLYIADAYFGLMKVGFNGGPAQSLATAAEGVSFVSLSALDIDPQTGIVYFLESSNRYQKRQISEAVKARDQTGRLLKYNPGDGKVTVLLRNLGLPLGLAVSRNGKFVVFSEFIFNRIQKYSIGDMAGKGKLETVTQLPAPPVSLSRIGREEFWVAMNNGTTSFGLKIGNNGKMLQTLIFDVENTTGFSSISQVNEFGRKFYVGSIYFPYVSVFDKP